MSRVCSLAVVVCTSLTSIHLSQCLGSLEVQAERAHGRHVVTLVVINVAEDQALKNFPDQIASIRDWHRSSPHHHLEFCAPRGIPYARNHALEWARKNSIDSIAFIDDDCVADPGWLETLVNTQDSYGADVVAGAWQIRPTSEPSAFIPSSTWKRQSYQVAGRETETGDELPFAYTRSVLFRIRGNPLIDSGLRFDVSRAAIGGSDVVFFREFARAGLTLVACQESLVVELYSNERISYGWHFKRKARNAQFTLERSRNGDPLGTNLLTVLMARHLLRLFFRIRIDGPPVGVEVTQRLRRLVDRTKAFLEGEVSPVRRFASNLGRLGFAAARVYGIVLYLMGIRVKSYEV